MITNNLNSHYAHIMNNKKNINSIKTQQTSIKNKINESVCICKYYDNDLFNFSVDSNDNYQPIKIINNYSVIFNNNLYQTITCAITEEVSIDEEQEPTEIQRYFTIIKRISSNYDESIIFYNKTQKIIIYNMIVYSDKIFVIYSLSKSGTKQINKFGYIQLSNSSIPNTINEISTSQYYPSTNNLNINKSLKSRRLRDDPEPISNPITNFCLITKSINNTIRNIIYI